MSTNFGGAGDQVSLGDVARFPRGTAHSILAFFRIENSAGDDRCIVAKWGDPSNTRQFLLRTDAQTAPSNLEVYRNGILQQSGSDGIQLNTWYVACVTIDGTSGANDGHLYLVGMDGTFIDDGLAFTASGDVSVLTTAVTLGLRTGGDDMDGDICFVCYVDRELSKDDILAFLFDPIRAANAWEVQSGVQFTMPLWGIHSPEIDLSANGVSGTLTGTTRSTGPPVTLFTPKWAASVPLIEAGGDQTITPSTISTSMEVIAPAVSNSTTITPSTISTTMAVIAPTIQQTFFITPTVISTSMAVIAPTVAGSGSATIAPATISTTMEVIAPTVAGSGSATITPTVISTTMAVIASTIQQTFFITPTVISTSMAVIAPTVAGSGSAPIALTVISTTMVVISPSVSLAALTISATVISLAMLVIAATARQVYASPAELDAAERRLTALEGETHFEL